MLSSKTKTILRKLSQKKHRKEMNAFTVEGVKGVQEALVHADVLMLVVDGAKREEKDITTLVTQAEQRDILVEFAGRKDIAAIKQTETFPGITAVVAMPEPEYDNIFDADTILVLDRINDPGNLGTIIRTADWFGVHTIILSEGSVDPYNEKVVRSTMGSIFRVHIIQTHNIVEMVETLKENRYSIAALDLAGTNIQKSKKTKKQALIFGSESHGVSDALKSLVDETYTIPGKGGAESLNLAVSVAIALYITSLQ